MQELQLPEMDLQPVRVTRARLNATVGPTRHAPAMPPPPVAYRLRDSPDPGPARGLRVVAPVRVALLVVFVWLIAAVGIAAAWAIGYLTHASGLQRGASAAARYGGAVLVGLVALIAIGAVVRLVVRTVVALVGSVFASGRTTKGPREPHGLVGVRPAADVRVGAVALPIGPGDVPDDPELAKWLKMRRPDYKYYLVRVVCSVDGRVDGLTVNVRLQSDTVAGPQPQVVSMLPKTSRSDSRVKRTVKFGANLKLIEASREEESNESRGPTAMLARGELQQLATWTLTRAARLDEEKQFLLVVERPASVKASASIHVTATMTHSDGPLALDSEYAGNPLDLSS
jgi:hypothetical protein